MLMRGGRSPAVTLRRGGPDRPAGGLDRRWELVSEMMFMETSFSVGAKEDEQSSSPSHKAQGPVVGDNSSRVLPAAPPADSAVYDFTERRPGLAGGRMSGSQASFCHGLWSQPNLFFSRLLDVSVKHACWLQLVCLVSVSAGWKQQGGWQWKKAGNINEETIFLMENNAGLIWELWQQIWERVQDKKAWIGTRWVCRKEEWGVVPAVWGATQLKRNNSYHLRRILPSTLNIILRKSIWILGSDRIKFES